MKQLRSNTLMAAGLLLSPVLWMVAPLSGEPKTLETGIRTLKLICERRFLLALPKSTHHSFKMAYRQKQEASKYSLTLLADVLLAAVDPELSEKFSTKRSSSTPMVSEVQAMK